MKRLRLILIAMLALLVIWPVAAMAQPTFTPIPLDNPTPQAGAAFGGEVAGVGDVNRDTVPDFLVGAPGQDVGGNVNQGRAFVFSGLDRTLLLTLDNPTPQAGAFFGSEVAGAGDVSNDGVPDLLVGVANQDVGGNVDQGQAFVFSGADGSLLLTLNDPTPQALALFGVAVAGVGDVNGDTVPDLLVGAHTQNVGGNLFQGQAFVFSGADGSLLLTLNDPFPQPFAGFGIAVAGIGSVNGDDVPDLVVGAHTQNVGRNDAQGQMFVFSGADGSLLLTLNAPATARGFFGGEVAGAGDVSVDGVPDLLVGAITHLSGTGQVFVFSGADGSLLHTLNNPTPQVGDSYGDVMAGIGDVSGDTVPDLLTGAPGQDVGGNVDQGQAFVFSGADGSLLLILNDPTPQAGAEFGSAVAGIGNVNGDTVPELVVGAPGQTVGGNVAQGQVFVFMSDTAPPGPSCDGHAATIVGAGNIIGTPGDDVIVGSQGPDEIDGRGGNDLICGRGGRDTIHGGDGDDRIFGGDGDDTLRGGDGTDTLFGGDGADLLLGGNGADELIGGRGSDTLRGEDGSDTLRGGDGRDTLFGGDGADRLLGEDGADELSGGAGADDCIGGSGADLFRRCEQVDQSP